jgi:protein-L-isoaspartate(D-aspartate) O-methyltransferase
METDEHWARERLEMVESQIQRRGVRDARVLEALRRVPRHRFLPPETRYLAYTDGPLPIGSGQTISQPYMVAAMSELLRLRGEETVLEIGTGSGYQAAVLAELCKTVHTIEFRPDLAQRASEVLQELGYQNIILHTGDGSLGWAAAAPYQGILVTAAAPSVPPPLLEQLADGSRLIIPVGQRGGQVLQVCEKRSGHVSAQEVMDVSFVPLRGSLGWKEEEWERFTC